MINMTNEEQILQNTEEILKILKEQWNIPDEEEPVDPVTPTDLMEELKNLPTNEEKIEYIKTKLEENEAYSEEHIILKIFTDKVGDTILEIKLRPYTEWGKTIDYFYKQLGDPDAIETSKYNMRLILWYKITKYIQQDVPDDGSSIIDKVTDEWGNRDDINANG